MSSPPPPPSEAPTQALPAERARSRFSGGVRGWLVGLLVAAAALLLLLLVWALGWLRPPQAGQAPLPTRELILGEKAAGEDAVVLGAAGAPAPEAGADIPPPGAPPGPPPAVGERFQSFYEGRGGLSIFGRPLGPPLTVNGREIQWFERARLEHWPEHAGTPYEVQLGRLGAEYTAGRDFAGQAFFVSRPDLRYFAETGHAVGGRFLAFWEQHGGLDVLGLPISEEFDEVLPDGATYRVQYFERARLEHHPRLAGTPYEVQVGLLGSALYSNERRPDTVQPVPTAVPLP